jgi:hypothetical protein
MVRHFYRIALAVYSNFTIHLLSTLLTILRYAAHFRNKCIHFKRKIFLL